MKAATYSEYGESSVLTITEVPEPHPGPGQVRIQVQASSVNPIDWKLRAGLLRDMMPVTFPVIPGQDAAGIVDEIGEGVVGVRPGDRVFGIGVAGTAAEHAVLGAWTQAPENWTTEQAAAGCIAGFTATRALDDLGVHDGMTVLIEGAAGGVGSAAVQIAVARGATVIGTAREVNHEFLRDLGAIPTTYGPGLPERVRALIPGAVDAVFHAAGPGPLAEFEEIAPSISQIVTINPATASQGARMASVPTDASSKLAAVATVAAAGGYTPNIAVSYPLERIGEAHDRSQGGHVQGKIILTV